MSKILTEDLIYEILSVVEEIPEGRVASYGQIARLIGRDKNARLVGKVCRNIMENIPATGSSIMKEDWRPISMTRRKDFWKKAWN